MTYWLKAYKKGDSRPVAMRSLGSSRPAKKVEVAKRDIKKTPEFKSKRLRYKVVNY